MKILLINDNGMPTYGAPLNMLRLRGWLRERGHDARLFSSNARPFVKRRILADYRCLGTTSHVSTLLQTANPWAFIRLLGIMRDFQPDVVHVGDFLGQMSPLILPLLRNVASLYHVSGYRSICPMAQKILPDGSICRSFAGMACYYNKCLPFRSLGPQLLELHLWQKWQTSFNLIVAVSRAVQHRLASEGIQQVVVLLCAVPHRPPRPPLSNPPSAAFAGRLIFSKGVDVLIRAFSKVLSNIPDAKLIIAGEGPEMENLRKLASDLEITDNLVMTGHLNQREMGNLFETAWVQVVPSRFEEPFGLVAVEGMMRGTALIASSIGGLTEIIEDGRSGFQIPPEDVDLLAKSLLLVLGNRNLAEKMGHSGRKSALHRFNQEDHLGRLIHIYQRLSESAID